MQIRSIKLVNFRQFKNETIEFSCEKDQNVTIIIGDNTAGKTTLVKAFLWGLYRVNNFTDKILLNREVANNMLIGDEMTVKVEIELEHSGVSYAITTKEVYFKDTIGIKVKTKVSTRVIKIDSSSSHIIPEVYVNNEISNILNPSLKEYFFFEGETNSIDSVGEKSSLKTAVSDLMGIKKIEQLRDYFDPNKSETVTSYIRNRLGSDTSDDLIILQENRNIKVEKQEQLLNTISSIEKQISDLEVQLQEKEAQINANQDVADDQAKKVTIKNRIIKNEAKKEEKFIALINACNQQTGFLKILFAYSFKNNNIEETLSETTFNSESSLTHISEEAVDQLIKRKKCLCGAEILTGTQAYLHLLEAKQHMEPQNFGKYASNFLENERYNVDNFAMNCSENIYNIACELNDLIQAIDNDKASLKEIEKRIEGRADVGALQIAARNIEMQIKSLEGQLKQIKEFSLPDIIKEIELIDNKIDSVTSKVSGNEKIKIMLKYAETIFKKAEKRINESRKNIKEELEKIVNDIFKTMYHGERKIQIDDNYKVDAIQLDGTNKTDKSTGCKTVMNFAFVAGLIQLVKEHIISKEELGEDGIDDEYPLVMDAPFSNTDEIHIGRICSALPLYCNQLIIVVMNKDFEHAKDSLGQKIGKFYKFKKHSEIYTTVEEV